MASWSIPDDGATIEWAREIATQYLEREGCDETCQVLGALLTSDLVRAAMTKSAGPVNLVIDHAAPQVELRVSSALIGRAEHDDDTLGLLKRLATSWGADAAEARVVTWCRFQCVAGHPRPCRKK